MSSVAVLPRWAYGPFELILHAEQHFRKGSDFDRRIAFISFDNSIEVSVTTYLSLHPIQRRKKEYEKALVEKWLKNYHSKLEFLEIECSARGLTMQVDVSHIVYYHSIRNDQYHGGRSTVPDSRDLGGIRDAALWAFSTLFDISNAEEVLDGELTRVEQPATQTLPDRDGELDELIDTTFEPLDLGSQLYLLSDLLYSHDPLAYREIGLELLNSLKSERVNK